MVATGEGPHGQQTALMWAVAQRHPAVVEVLLEHGADVHARSSVFTQVVKTTRETANDGTACVPREECYIIDIQQGGYTPLLFAARVGDLVSARLLVGAGADVNDVAPQGTSALGVAAHSGHGDVGRLGTPLRSAVLGRGHSGASAWQGGVVLRRYPEQWLPPRSEILRQSRIPSPLQHQAPCGHQHRLRSHRHQVRPQPWHTRG